MRKIITITFVFVSGAVLAQVNPELNGLIRQSMNYFPRVQELIKSEEINELRIDVAKSNYLPNITGTGSYTYVNPLSQKEFGEPGNTQLLVFNPHNNYNFNIGLNQVIWDFGKTKAQIEKSKADLLVAHQNTESAKLTVASQVASVYYAMIYLKRSAEVQDTVINFYVENKKIIEGKLKEGDALQIDLSTIQNNIDQELNRKVEFERQYNRQMALLQYTTGQSTAPVSQSLEFQYVPTAGDVASNPDVLAATERIASAQSDIKLAEGNKLPSLTFQAGAGYKNAYQPDINALRFNYLAGATLNFPIFQGGRARQNYQIARKSAQLSEVSKTNVMSTLQKDLVSAQSDVKAYDTQIKNAEGQIKLANETVRLTRVRYKQGAATYLDLINAGSNLQRAYLNQLQYQYQKTLALVETCRLVGVKFWQE